MWTNFFEAGGFGMYPTSLFGFLLVAAGVVLILRPERRYLWLVMSLWVLTLGSGVLGTCVGVVNTLHYLRRVPADEQLKIVAMGCAESLHNVVLALMLVVLTTLLASIAAFRAARAPGSAAAAV